MLGFAELLEFLAVARSYGIGDESVGDVAGDMMLRAAQATSDYYLAHTPTDGIPYWDTGAPDLDAIGAYLDLPADPFNPYEPVDSSAAAIAAQGLLRLGRFLASSGNQDGDRYFRAGLTVLQTLLSEPYLSTDENHDGILLHTIYHRPNAWDHVADGDSTPHGESALWGDYHLLEAALYTQRLFDGGPYYTFFGPNGEAL
jgi:hypothetical protein